MENDKSIAHIHATHTPDAIHSRLEAGPVHSYLRDFIYGAVDGIVTTFAVVSGVAGAGLTSDVVIILGAANLAGDGLSMAVSNYLGTRADRQLVDRARRIEEAHIAAYPEGEREEIRQIFRAKGMSGSELEQIVGAITSDRKRWISTMIQEEYGLSLLGVSPLRAAAVTFGAFVLLGALPLVSFIWQFFAPNSMTEPYVVSSIIAAIAFFFVGAVKGRFVFEHWYWSGLETCIVGGAAASLAYFVGVILRGVVS